MTDAGDMKKLAYGHPVHWGGVEGKLLLLTSADGKSN